ncbi:MAG: pyridoxine 5'-phosphate synthase [Verrucomicrobiales bacterium]
MSAILPRTLKLGVNIDHVATLRQARYAPMLDAHNAEPSVLAAAHEVEAAGADSITVHLRLDRRHVQDSDVFELREKISTKLNLEMGNTDEILRIALNVKPDFACIVPENRREITTEGGLNVRNADTSLQRTIRALQDNGSRVSLFVDPDLRQVEAVAGLGADMIELHTGAFANASPDGGDEELQALREAAELGHSVGLQVNAGHGITIGNLPKLMKVPSLAELNVGHHLVAKALFTGLSRSVQDMLTLMVGYPAGA